MWEAPLYLEYASRERMKEVARETQSACLKARLQPSRLCGLRRRLARRLARRLVSLGLYLDPHAAGSSASGGGGRLAPD
jgi:hypothetical protein